jgi:uncharacterized PurR-regulated membrane protein YhhQ (DUF165 family)
MFIAKRAVIIAYVIICVIVAIAITLKKKRNPHTEVKSEIEYYFKAFLTNLILGLLTTPIVLGIYRWLEKKSKKKDNNGY